MGQSPLVSGRWAPPTPSLGPAGRILKDRCIRGPGPGSGAEPVTHGPAHSALCPLLREHSPKGTLNTTDTSGEDRSVQQKHKHDTKVQLPQSASQLSTTRPSAPLQPGVGQWAGVRREAPRGPGDPRAGGRGEEQLLLEPPALEGNEEKRLSLAPSWGHERFS